VEAAVLGHGIYGASEAARLLGITSQRANAWFRGWPGGSDPLLQSDYSGQFGRTTISFLDLVDASVIVTLRERHRASTTMIRRLRSELQRLWGEHPFSRQEFFLDEKGRKVFVRIASEEGEEQFIEILKQQHAMPEVLLPVLKRVEYDPSTRLAQTLELAERVIIDPRRKYGKPIVVGTGMPTVILYECYRATGNDEHTTADWYNVDPEDVRAAVQFETDFSGIAA